MPLAKKLPRENQALLAEESFWRVAGIYPTPFSIMYEECITIFPLAAARSSGGGSKSVINRLRLGDC